MNEMELKKLLKKASDEHRNTELWRLRSSVPNPIRQALAGARVLITVECPGKPFPGFLQKGASDFLLLEVPFLWPSLRGVDVVPVEDDGLERASETVVLAPRQVPNGFELEFLPEELGVLNSDHVAIRFAVVSAAEESG